MQKLNANYLEQLRNQALMNVVQFAKFCEISTGTYKKIMRGDEVTNRIAKKLIGHLQLDKERFLNRGV